MKLKIYIIAMSLFAGAWSTTSCDSAGDKKNDSTPNSTATNADTIKRFSYAYGVLIGNAMKQQKFTIADINVHEVAEAIKAVLEDAPLTISLQEAQMELEKVNKTKVEKQLAVKKAEEGKWFAENVDNKPGIQKTNSGLRYEILKEGNGPKPTAQEKVKVHYHGTRIDGAVFDSSLDRGEPAVFPVNNLIPAWIEALQMMPTGSKWKIYVPFNLGYGARSAGPKIPPFSTLIFELELFSIEN